MSGDKRRWWRDIGPGLVLAATGVGAGDLIAAAVVGARYGTVLLWAALLGAGLKLALNEGLARWQLATGSTLLEGWMTRLPRFIAWYFLVYLVLWSFVVAGALMVSCGLAGHALFHRLSVTQWGILHSLAAAILVLTGRYAWLEWVMKALIGIMFAVILTCALLVLPAWPDLISGLLVPRLPDGSMTFVFGVIGGVGGSVTLLSYGYWIRERGWFAARELPRVRVDLTAGYLLTGLFGVAIMIVAAGLRPGEASGNQMALNVARHLGSVTGPAGEWLFLIGFWGAVFSSMLGVWQGIPYLFADFMGHTRFGRPVGVGDRVAGSPLYRAWLAFMALPPMLLLFVSRPVWVVVAYAVSGAFFMPFLAALLLYMNNKTAWMGSLRNRWFGNLLLAGALLLFGFLLWRELR